MRILFIGDIVGKGGRKAVAALGPVLKREYGCSFCIANGENMAGGAGMTRKCLNELRDSGVDIFSGGDHMWDQRDFMNEVDALRNVVRPANVNPVQPGRGWRVCRTPDGISIAVICLLGRTFMASLANSPFEAADRILEELGSETKQIKHIVVDFHAEATSEKTALARRLDGRVSAVLGTHTHVPTADETVLPGGTAFQCDVGMVGARESILGRAVEPVVRRFTTGMPHRFTVVDAGIRLHATVVDLDANGRATGIERVARDYD